jgi:hypothetical protein
LLAEACDRASQRAVADRLSAAGFNCSSGTISKLINRKYPASTAEPERAVLAIYGGDDVACPLHGEIPLQAASATGAARGRRAIPPSISLPLRPTCPNNTDGGDQ